MPGTFDEAGWNANSASQEGTNLATTQEPVQPEGERLPQYGEGDDEIARARARAEAILAEERSRKAAA